MIDVHLDLLRLVGIDCRLSRGGNLNFPIPAAVLDDRAPQFPDFPRRELFPEHPPEVGHAAFHEKCRHSLSWLHVHLSDGCRAVAAPRKLLDKNLREIFPAVDKLMLDSLDDPSFDDSAQRLAQRLLYRAFRNHQGLPVGFADSPPPNSVLML